MKAAIQILALTLVFTQLGANAAPLALFVSSKGKDTWSGKNAEPGANDGPFATLPTALKAARQTRSKGQAPDGVTIWMREGMYDLAQPLVLTHEDSGASLKEPLTIAAWKSEKPVISGGRRITGWKAVAGNSGLWATQVPAVREGKWYFHQLFINGERAQRARTPNKGFFRIDGPSPQSKPVQFKFKPGEIKPAWAEDGDVEVIALLAWADIRMQIRAVDEAKNTVTLSGNPRPSNRENNAQYYIENTSDALDQPGEWYLDRKTGRLIYWAKPGQNMNQAEVIAPELTELVYLQGDFATRTPVEFINFRGLTFSYTDWTLPDSGHADTQAAIGSRGDLLAEAAADCRIEDCTFSHLGGYAIELGGGCKRIKVIGNEMTDLAAGGVRVGETAVRQNDFEQSQGHVITDNHIHHVGVVYLPAVGVLVLQSGQNRIAHNHIHDLYYTAVSVGWTWGYRESPCKENIVEFNHMHDIGQFLLSDMGAVYTLGPQPGTIVRNNVIHDVNSFTYGGWGLYTDEGSTGIVMENNVVYRTKSAGFHQHYGKENIIRNNIFAFGKEYQLMRTRDEPHTSFFFSNNIAYFDSGKLLGSSWKNENYVIDHNLYFDARPGTSAGSMQFSGATWAQWRERKHDENSIIADPLFVAPEQYNFALKPNSPALKIGFKPIDVSKVGIRLRNQRTE